MIIATLAVILLVLMILIDWEFWPPLFSWILLPFAIVYGLWWSNDLALFPFTDEIDSAAVVQFLWYATILTVAFFGTVAGWSVFQLMETKSTQNPFAVKKNMTRLGQLLVASKHSSNDKS